MTSSWSSAANDCSRAELILEQEIVIFPEHLLIPRAEGGQRGQMGFRSAGGVTVDDREIAEYEENFSGFDVILPQAYFRRPGEEAAIRALVIGIFFDNDFGRRITRFARREGLVDRGASAGEDCHDDDDTHDDGNADQQVALQVSRAGPLTGETSILLGHYPSRAGWQGEPQWAGV
jgi:hypothetical protein